SSGSGGVGSATGGGGFAATCGVAAVAGASLTGVCSTATYLFRVALRFFYFLSVPSRPWLGEVRKALVYCCGLQPEIFAASFGVRASSFLSYFTPRNFSPCSSSKSFILSKYAGVKTACGFQPMPV